MKRFIRSILRALGFELFPAYSESITLRQLRNFRHYARAFDRIKGLSGNVVECGVGKGRSLLYFSYLSNAEKKDRIIWGFDSFEGFPEPTREDDSIRAPKKGDWKGNLPDHMVKKLRSSGLSHEWISSHVKLVKGFFEDTLSQYDGSPIAILHIDADLYDSYKVVLEKFLPFVVTGGVVLFDEYAEVKWPGATQAVDEFLKDKPYKIQKDEESGKYFFVKH